MPRTLPLVLVLSALVVSGCGASQQSSDAISSQPAAPASSTAAPSVAPSAVASDSESDQPLRRQDPSVGADLALPATGILGGEAIEGGCVSIDIDGQRYQLLAAPDSGLVVDPGNFVVADEDGNVIATEGDEVTVDGEVDPGMATFCQIGPVLLATEVSPA